MELDRIEVVEEKPRTLCEICHETKFQTSLLGNTYCSIAKTTKIDCPYISEQKDQNNLYPCLNPNYDDTQKIQ